MNVRCEKKKRKKNKEKDSREGKRVKKCVKWGSGEMRKEGKWRKVQAMNVRCKKKSTKEE